MTGNFQLLAKAAQEAYGRQWRRPLAKYLDVSEKTIGRWKSGETKLDDEIWDSYSLSQKLTKLLNKRIEQVQTIVRQLK